MERVAQDTARLAETPLPELVAELARQSAMINTARARQHELVAAITHTQTIEAEDGTLLHLPMTEAVSRLDAAALVAGPLGVSQQAAQQWVERAEKLTGPLAAVREAMADGVVDDARAKIIGEELADATDEVAAVVAEHLMPGVRAGLVEDPSGVNGEPLRRRVRAALAQVDPDAVRERAEKTRRERSLKWWTTQAGAEAWFATLPAGQSLKAKAAIDELARQFIKDGRSESLEQARADAMLALIEGQSTVSYVMTIGIPLPDHLSDPDPVAEAPDPTDPPDHHDPVVDPPATDGPAAPAAPAAHSSGVGDSVGDADRASTHASDIPDVSDHGASPGSRAEDDNSRASHSAGDAERGSPRASDIPDVSDHGATNHGYGHGAPAAAEDADQRLGESSVSGQAASRHGERGVAEVVAAVLAALARQGDSDIEITGGGNPQSTEVSAAWVAQALAQAARDGKVRLAAVHPDTGALIDPDNTYATASYVPGKALSGLVKARDGKCRFPGCTLNVRFTDLDHTRPWPEGATSADNLHSLCRRHHRVKQLVGWHVALRPDGTVEWVDPLGRRYLTWALDHRGRPQAPPTTGPAAEASRHTSPEEQAAEQEARPRRIEAALRREAPISASPFEDHHEHVLLRIERDIARRACRTGARRSTQDHRPDDRGRNDRGRHDIVHLNLHSSGAAQRARVVLDPDTFGPRDEEPPF